MIASATFSTCPGTNRLRDERLTHAERLKLVLDELWQIGNCTAASQHSASQQAGVGGSELEEDTRVRISG